jgi:hypothetical protein
MFTTSPLSSPTDVLKDVRAYERERQRVKKVAELVKAKERSIFAGRNTWGPSVAKSGKTSWFGGKGLLDTENGKGEKEPLDTEEPVMSLEMVSKKDSSDGELKLADLVTSRKPRKNKGGSDLRLVL